MPFNGAGAFSLVVGNPVVVGTIISPTTHNNTNADIAIGLSNCVTRDGQSPAANNLPMGGFKLTGLAAGTFAGDSLRYEQVSTSAALAALVTDETGTGSLVFATSPTLVTPLLGTPASGVLTNCTGLVPATGLSSVTGTGAAVLANSPVLVTPDLGTPSALVGTNITGTAAGLSIGGNAANATTVTDAAITNAKLASATAGVYLCHQIMAAVNISSPAVTTHSIKVGRAGTYTTRFYLSGQAGNITSGRIYKNGVAFGTARAFNASLTNTYVEDLSFSANDVISLVCGINGGPAFSFTSNLTVSENNPPGGGANYNYVIY